jgi:predicted nuclease with TOPRIM domain
MSDTPRTDRAWIKFVTSHVQRARNMQAEAKELERELTKVTKQRDAANDAIVRLRDRFRELYKNAESLCTEADAASNIEACQELVGDYSCYIKAASLCNIELDKLSIAAVKGGSNARD